MIKECPIIKNNEYVAVVKYGDIFIQFPSIDTKEKTVFVFFDGNHYKIVDRDYAKRRRIKKATVETAQKELVTEATEE